MCDLMIVVSVHQPPLALVVQGRFCRRGIVGINGAEAAEHCGGMKRFTVLID